MRAFVLGSPIAHSLSPTLHRAAYAYLGLDWEYDARQCDTDSLADLVASLGPDVAGLSLTMPLKAAVLPLLDEVDPLASACGAVNTVVRRDGRLVGYNTDVPGMAAALAERSVPPLGRASVLGAGATARSAVLALALAGWKDIVVSARRPVTGQWLQQALQQAQGQARDGALPTAGSGAGLVVTGTGLGPLDLDAALSGALVVCTLPAGAADAFVDRVPDRPGTLFDVVYDPWPTALAAAWAEHGGQVIAGLDLLVHQGALQVVLMTGTGADIGELVAVMRAAGQAAMTARAG